MNKFLLLTSASVLAIGIATPAKAATLGELCGTEVAAKTKVQSTTEDLTTTTECGIELSGGAILAIKDADITLADELVIFGTGSVVIRDETLLDAKLLDIQLTSGDITIKDSEIKLDDDTTAGPVTPPLLMTGSGAINLKNNEFNTQDGLEIYGGGDVTVKDNDLNMSDGPLDIGSTGGNIAVIGNDFRAQGTEIESLGGDVVVNDNIGGVFQMTIEGVDVTYNGNTIAHSQTFQIDADGDLAVKENDFGNPNSLDFEFDGSCKAKDNIDPAFVCP